MEKLKLDSVKVLDCMKLSHSLSILWVNALVPIISGLWITNVLQYGVKYISRKKSYFENNLSNSFILLHLHKAEIRRMGSILEKNVVLKIAFLLISQVKKKTKKPMHSFTKNKLFHRYFSMTLVLFLRTPLIQNSSW